MIDGEWGIGKTYAVKKWMCQSKEKYNTRYVSVFGKQNIRDIENSILIKLMGLIVTKFSKGSYKKSKRIVHIIKSMRDVTFNLISQKIGIPLEATEYVKNISIEEFLDPKPSGKKTIICVDDLERKSDISMVDLLGLIERIKENYSVIIIANTDKFIEDVKIFETYKEKVIDYEFKFDEISPEIQWDVVSNIFEKNRIKDEIKNLIIEKYNKPLSVNITDKLDSELRNIRIFKKYAYLVYRVIEEIEKVLEINSYTLEKEIVLNCKRTIFMYYYSEKFLGCRGENKIRLSYRDIELIEIFRQIFIGGKYSTTKLKSLVANDSEITDDLKKMYTLYKLRKDEINQLFDKIDKNVKGKEIEYFVNQEKIITMLDAIALNGYKDPEIYYKDFIDIALILYEPSIYRTVLEHDQNKWFDVGFWGGLIPCLSVTSKFISEVNEKNIEKYKIYKKQNINIALEERNIDLLNDAISQIDAFCEGDIERIFEFAFQNLDSNSHEKVWKLLYRLINVVGYEPIDKLLQKKKEENKEILAKMRLQHLEEVNEENNYYYSQAEEAAKEKIETGYATLYRTQS